MLSNKPQLSLLVRTGPTTDAKLETHARGGASPSPHFVRAQKSRREKPCWFLPATHIPPPAPARRLRGRSPVPRLLRMFSDLAHPWSNVRIADHSLTAQVAWVSMRTRASMNLQESFRSAPVPQSRENGRFGRFRSVVNCGYLDGRTGTNLTSWRRNLIACPLGGPLVYAFTDHCVKRYP
jgi:hypothetical protein